MKVSVLTPDLTHNCLGRAVLLAQLAERNHEVEIVGPKMHDHIWTPMADEYDYQAVESGNRIYQFAPDIPKLLDCIDGDVVLSSKPRLQSYGVGLLAKLRDDVPVVLDIDDWESGFKLGRGQFIAYAWGVPTLVNTDSFYYYRVLEALSGLADKCTVSNRFLQEKFDGELIRHVRDTDKFNPARFDKDEARQAFDLPKNMQLVMFSGTPRPHKGVAELVRAVAAMDSDDVRVVVVGGHESSFVDQLRQEGGDALILRGQQPFNEIPRWLSAADIVAIPQRDSPSARGQLPAKVFDAMAMAKPIVASNVADIPEVLNGCGSLVAPGSETELREAINALLADADRRDELGRRARQRCVEKYSYDAVAPRLAKVIKHAATT